MEAGNYMIPVANLTIIRGTSEHALSCCLSHRPAYVTQVFPQIFGHAEFIHPKANADKASDSTVKAAQKMQSIFPDTPVSALKILTTVLGQILLSMHYMTKTKK